MASMATEEISVRLMRPQVALLVESLDSHEFWQLGDVLPRKDGQVFIPGDMEPDLLWEDEEPTAEQRAAIDDASVQTFGTDLRYRPSVQTFGTDLRYRPSLIPIPPTTWRPT